MKNAVLLAAFFFTFVSFAAADTQPFSHGVPACPPGDAEHATCAALVVPGASASIPNGLTPAMLHKAYALPATAKGTAPIIAIISAFDAPTLQHDLTYYSMAFGIPVLPRCKGAIAGSATPCFKKVDQRGGHHFSTSTAWSISTTDSTEIAHAICQNCGILVVEADDNSDHNSLAASDEAVALGAKYVILDGVIFGSEDQSLEQSDDPHYDHPGVLFVAPQWPGGYGFSYPADSRFVIGAGGTILETSSDGSYQSEELYAKSASYCTKYENKPGWQSDPDCAHRMGTDLVADAAYNIPTYDSTPDGNGDVGWFLSGGTVNATSIIAGAFALANDDKQNMNKIPYTHYTASNFNDITAGSNGACKKHPYFCNAEPGYDGPSGLGSPHGIRGL